jgi:hypothetical protein
VIATSSLAALAGCSSDNSAAGVVAHGQIGVTSIATDGQFVYWVTSSGTLARVTIAGGGEPQTLATGLVAPKQVVVDDTRAYWITDSGRIESVPKAGGDRTVLAFDTGGRSLAVAGDDLVFVDPAHVMSFPKDGGQPTTLANDPDQPQSLWIDGQSVVWTSGASGTQMGAIRKVALAGGPSVDEITKLLSPAKIWAQGATTVWTSAPGVKGAVAVQDALGVRELVKDVVGIDEVLSDGRDAFYSTTDGSVFYIPLDGSAYEQRVVQGPAGKVSLAITSTSLVWANSADGAILARSLR